MAKKQFKAESKRLLDLMVNSIYTHKEIFLRELISNASDAEDKLAYKSLTDENVDIKRKDLKITIVPDKEGRLLTVSDNGIGMSKEDLELSLIHILGLAFHGLNGDPGTHIGQQSAVVFPGNEVVGVAVIPAVPDRGEGLLPALQHGPVGLDADGPVALGGGGTPVSYTHLDVYKRQGQQAPQT